MTFLFIILFILIGFWLKKISNKNTILDNLVRIHLSRYIIFIVLPAIVLLKLPHIEFGIELITPLIVCWGLIPVAWVIVKKLSNYYKWSREVEGTVLLVSIFGNTSFVGFPIISAFYGKESLIYALLYDQLGSFLSLAIVGNMIIAFYSTNNIVNATKPDLLKAIAYKVFTFPPFIAIFFAIFLRFIPLNTLMETLLSSIATTLIPATMILVGYHLVFKLPHNLLGPIIASLSIKMIIFPVITFIILINLGQTGLVAKVSLMESAMPTMVSASILAIEAKLESKLAAACVGYGLLLSIIIMPAIFYFSKLF